MNLLRLLTAAVIVLFIGLWFAVGIGHPLSGTTLEITNSLPEELFRVKGKFHGGEFLLDKIPANSTRYLKLNVMGESGLEIEFADANNRVHRAAVNIYLETNSVGITRLTIRSLDRVDSSSCIL